MLEIFFQAVQTLWWVRTIPPELPKYLSPRPACTHPTQYYLDMLISITVSISRPTQACLYPSDLISLGPAHIHHTQYHSGLAVSIMHGHTQACLYPLYPCLGLLRPAHIHWTWYHLGLLKSIISISRPTQACSYPSYSVSLRPVHIHCYTHI